MNTIHHLAPLVGAMLLVGCGEVVAIDPGPLGGHFTISDGIASQEYSARANDVVCTADTALDGTSRLLVDFKSLENGAMGTLHLTAGAYSSEPAAYNSKGFGSDETGALCSVGPCWRPWWRPSDDKSYFPGPMTPAGLLHVTTNDGIVSGTFECAQLYPVALDLTNGSFSCVLEPSAP